MCIEHSQTHKQWFQYLIKIQHTQIQDCNSILPKLYFNFEILYEIFKKLDIIPQSEQLLEEIQTYLIDHDQQGKSCFLDSQRYDSPYQHLFQYDNYKFQKILALCQENIRDQEVNVYLILQMIVHDSYGLKKQGFLEYSFGQVINCDIKDIHAIVALNKSNRFFNRHFPTISRWLNIDYIEIPLVKNSQIPEWMSYSYKHQILELQGCWSSNDENHTEIMIRIYNKGQIILKEFKIQRIFRKIDKKEITKRHSIQNSMMVQSRFSSHQTKLSKHEDKSSFQQRQDQINDDDGDEDDDHKKSKSCYTSPRIVQQAQTNQSFDYQKSILKNKGPQIIDIDSESNEKIVESQNTDLNENFQDINVDRVDGVVKNVHNYSVRGQSNSQVPMLSHSYSTCTEQNMISIPNSPPNSKLNQNKYFEK